MSLLKHVSIYSAGSLLVALAGFVSFPILTRVFSVADYGILNLISVTLLLLIGVAKLGQQHAIVRFYGPAAASGRQSELDKFCSTALGGMLITASLVTVIWAIASQMLPQRFWNDPRVLPILLLTAVLVILRTLDSGLNNLLRAQQRSATFSAFSVGKRYATLVLVIGAVLWIAPTLAAFYSATIAAEALGLLVLAVVALRGVQVSARNFSPALLRAMLAFGIPMVGYEVAGVILSLGDRYVLQILMGPESVGLYSAAYNVCEYVQTILVVSMAQAALPMYLKVWEEQGREKTQQLLETTLYFYVVAGMPVIFGMWAIAPELLSTLASSKYAVGAAVIPWVIAGMVIDGAMPMLSAGLYTCKKSKVIVLMVGTAAAVNVLLNVVLIPYFGIIGSAAATLASYLALAAMTARVSAKYLEIRMPWTAMGAAGVCAVLMWAVTSRIEMGLVPVTLLTKVAVGIAVYTLLLLVIDPRARDSVRAFRRRLQTALT